MTAPRNITVERAIKLVNGWYSGHTVGWKDDETVRIEHGPDDEDALAFVLATILRQPLIDALVGAASKLRNSFPVVAGLSHENEGKGLSISAYRVKGIVEAFDALAAHEKFEEQS